MKEKIFPACAFGIAVILFAALCDTAWAGEFIPAEHTLFFAHYNTSCDTVLKMRLSGVAERV